jgi:hypothetical protein
MTTRTTGLALGTTTAVARGVAVARERRAAGMRPSMLAPGITTLAVVAAAAAAAGRPERLG